MNRTLLTLDRQFGNMLVLATAWNDNRLRKLVDGWRFQVLLDRTIRFLDDLTGTSPQYAVDRDVLVRLRLSLFGSLSCGETLPVGCCEG